MIRLSAADWLWENSSPSSLCLADEVDWEKGKVSGAVYWGDETLTKLLVQVTLTQTQIEGELRHLSA